MPSESTGMPVSYLTTDEVAARFRTTRATMQNERSRGSGPKYLKLGQKVLYPLSVIEEYERARMVDPADKAAGPSNA